LSAHALVRLGRSRQLRQIAIRVSRSYDCCPTWRALFCAIALAALDKIIDAE